MKKIILTPKNFKILRNPPILSITPCGASTSYNNNSKNFTFSFKPSEWKAAISEAEKIVGYSTSFLSLRCLLSDELSNVAVHMKKLVGTSHPLIKTAQKLFQDGKQSMQTRGLMVLLMSKTAGPAVSSNLIESMVSGIYPSQRTLAEITELIHTATLIHKSVIDLCNICIGSPLEEMEFGNKMAVLSGDFLLANASTYLASLNNTKVVEMISTAIRDIMKGEFSNLKNIKSIIQNRRVRNENDINDNTENYNRIIINDNNNSYPHSNKNTSLTGINNISTLNHNKSHDDDYNDDYDDVGNKFKSELTIKKWEEQTYLSSGSLLAHSCQGALALAKHDTAFQTHAFQFGKSMALAHQFKEDLTKLYEPPVNDDDYNSVTIAPVILYANKLMRDNNCSGDDGRCNNRNKCNKNKYYHCKELFDKPSKEISKLVLSDKSVMKESKDLCIQYGMQAIQQLTPFRDSSAKNALKNMIKAVINV